MCVLIQGLAAALLRASVTLQMLRCLDHPTRLPKRTVSVSQP